MKYSLKQEKHAHYTDEKTRIHEILVRFHNCNFILTFKSLCLVLYSLFILYYAEC